MGESVYSKTLLKRFENSLKEKNSQNTYLKVLKEQTPDNDVSPMRKVYDKGLSLRSKTNENIEVL